MTAYRPPTPKPCSDCPFRRASMPGWLGAGSPESFLDCLQRDEPLPCHQTIDYDDPRWLEKWNAQQGGSMCGGALIFLANKLQHPRTRGFPTLPSDRVTVFSDSLEFVRHHREAPVHSWDDDGQNEGAQLQRELVRHAAEAAGRPIVDFGRRATPSVTLGAPEPRPTTRRGRQNSAGSSASKKKGDARQRNRRRRP